MSDWSGKHRPLLERIACLSGRSMGIPSMGCGGIPSLTDQDIAAAVAVARQRDDAGKPLPTCIRPEILLLHYGDRRDFTYRIARATWNAICKNVKKEDGLTARLACILAAECMAGRTVDQATMKQQAWIAGKNYASLEREFGYAKAWIEGEMHEAAFAYVAFLSNQLESAAKKFRRAG